MIKKKAPGYALFRTVMPSWDNTPRQQNEGNIFVNGTPDSYVAWLAHAVKYTGQNHSMGERLIFINAWNEWGEGCHLEPDRKYGDRFLKATKSVVERFCST
jgi:lipopolysaccharide biosynthesis protein